MSSMKMKAVLAGTTFVRKGKDIAVFAFQPTGRTMKTAFRLWIDGNWGTYDLEPQWTPVGLAGAVYSEQEGPLVIASDTDGELWEVRTASGTERATEIPGDYSELTNLASFGGAIWACGMGRVVLRRDASGIWSDLSAPDPSVDLGVIGFTGLAGIEAGDFVAVGWKGEIWWWHDGRWEAQDSATNANLIAVSVGPDGQGVAVGAHVSV